LQNLQPLSKNHSDCIPPASNLCSAAEPAASSMLPWLAAGVASGATRAALTQHFALRKNAADVSAKVTLQQLPVLPVGKMY
jgi:hypothetical protein